jgi:hypothetical protein
MASKRVPISFKAKRRRRKFTGQRGKLIRLTRRRLIRAWGTQCRGAACDGLQAAKAARLMNQYHSSFADLTEGETMDRGMSVGTFRRRAKRQSRGVGALARQPKRPCLGTLAQVRNLILSTADLGIEVRHPRSVTRRSVLALHGGENGRRSVRRTGAIDFTKMCRKRHRLVTTVRHIQLTRWHPPYGLTNEVRDLEVAGSISETLI